MAQPGAFANIVPPNMNGHQYGLNLPGLPHHASDSDDESTTSSEPAFSTINLTINAPLQIKGDNNLVAINPSTGGSHLAQAIVEALKQISASSGGIPMIDEEGRPRPLHVSLNAECTVVGSRNVVGERSVVAGGGLALKKKLSEEKKAAAGLGVGLASGVASGLGSGLGLGLGVTLEEGRATGKRDREDSEPVEGEPEKRVKKE